MSIIDQIIQIKKKYGILEGDSTDVRQREWYEWAIPHGHCIVITWFGRVVGFLDWVRLEEAPVMKNGLLEYKLNHDVIDTAPIAFAGTAYAKSASILRRLKTMAMERTKDCHILCWHSKRRNRIIIKRRSYV